MRGFVTGTGATTLDLLDVDIQPYEYGRALDGDGFATVVDALVSHEIIAVATPVYWYAMSSRMKTLFDRLTDLVTVRKDLGRKLAGRTLAVLSCGADPHLPAGFDVPFRDTARYLGMTYVEACYRQITKDPESIVSAAVAAETFGRRLLAR